MKTSNSIDRVGLIRQSLLKQLNKRPKNTKNRALTRTIEARGLSLEKLLRNSESITPAQGLLKLIEKAKKADRMNKSNPNFTTPRKTANKGLDALLRFHTNNQLLDFHPDDFIPYGTVKATDIVPAISVAVQEAEENIDALVKKLKGKATSFKDLEELSQTTETLDKFWIAMAAVPPALFGKPEFSMQVGIASRIIISLSMKQADVENDFINRMPEDEINALNPIQRRSLEKIRRSAILSGAELNDKDKAKFEKLSNKLSDLKRDFMSVLRNGSDHVVFVSDESRLKGLSETDIANAAKTLKKYKRTKPNEVPKDAKWAFTSGDTITVIPPVMMFAEDESLRKELYEKFIAIGTHPDQSNLETLGKIFETKQKLAKIFGFKDAAEYDIQTAMAGNPEVVHKFLEDFSITKGLRQKALEEMEELRKEKAKLVKGGEEVVVNAWDIPFLQEKARLNSRGVDTAKVKEYFELNNVIQNGLIHIAEKRYGLKFTPVEDKSKTWDPDVKLYEVFKKDKKRGNVKIGRIYMDLFQRAGKNPGSIFNAPITDGSRRKDGSRQLAQVALSMSFKKGEEATLLTPRDLWGFYHEFGHALHFLQTEAKQKNLGAFDTPIDLVETPSQYMEEFAFLPEVLKNLAQHYKTGEALDEDTIQKIYKSRNLGKALELTRRVENAMYSLLMSKKQGVDGKALTDYSQESIQKLYTDVCDKYGAIPSGPRKFFPWSNVHQVHYGALVFGYPWASALSSKIFSLQMKQAQEREISILDRELGEAMYKGLLSQGDAYHGEQMVKAVIANEDPKNFRAPGQEWSPDLRYSQEVFELN